MLVLIDSGVIGLLTNPNKKGITRHCEDWLYNLLLKGIYVASSDICDYEVRRSLLLESLRKPRINSVDNLNRLREIIDFLALDTEVMGIASKIWARLHYEDQPTANKTDIDVDVLISAHWRCLKSRFPSRYIVIATTNVKHLARLAEAQRWELINL